MIRKKAHEEECLQYVIDAANLQRGRSKQILRMFSNPEYEDNQSERPDFVKICPPTKKGRKHVLLGIEHFQVDHFSIEQKSDKLKVGATVNKIMRNQNQFGKKWIGTDFQSEEQFDSAIHDLLNVAASWSKARQNATYNAFLYSFGYSLDKHIQHVDDYMDRLGRLSEGKYETELAFLIEVYYDFQDLVLHSNGEVQLSGSSFLPFFEEVVSLLESVSRKGVKYIVLCFSLVHEQKKKVVALESKNIRSQLAKQHIPVYHYAGDDNFLSKFERMQKDLEIKPSFVHDGKNVNITWEYSSREMSMESRSELVMSAFWQVKKYQARGLNFATTRLVQLVLEVYGDVLVNMALFGFGDAFIRWLRITGITQKIIDERYQKFLMRWGPREEEGVNE